jgi:hypothetical protein
VTIDTRGHAAAAANQSAELRYVDADCRVKPAPRIVDHSRHENLIDNTRLWTSKRSRVPRRRRPLAAGSATGVGDSRPNEPVYNGLKTWPGVVSVREPDLSRWLANVCAHLRLFGARGPFRVSTFIHRVHTQAVDYVVDGTALALRKELRS